MRRSTSSLHEVVEIVENLPGITSAEVLALMPHEPKVNIHRHLSYLAKIGRITRRVERPFKHFPGSNEKPKPKAIPLASTRIHDLEAKIAELQQWKAMAIARFPDLAVDPVVMQARRIAIEAAPEYKDEIERGRRDNSALIRGIVIALTQVAA